MGGAPSLADAGPLSPRAKLVDDLDIQTSGPLISLTYRDPTAALLGMSAKGAAGVNAQWESGARRQWYIEEQRVGEVAAIGGIVTFDPATVEGAIRLFNWGFARQVANGSFAGTSDPFHSTSFFVAAVAHTCLFVRRAVQSGRFPLAERYLQRFAPYTALVQRAARWMAQPHIWSAGLALNEPFTHRRYLVGAALGLSGVLAGDHALIERARPLIENGLALQRPDGVNPEIGGHDSSYQMTGVVFAQHWVTNLPDDPLTPRVRAMIQRALTWEANRVLPSGEVSAQGNSRTAGQERSRAGVTKGVAYSRVIRGFAAWAALTGEPSWAELAWRTGRYYYGTPALATRPLLP
jgi:hypothetical protein